MSGKTEQSWSSILSLNPGRSWRAKAVVCVAAIPSTVLLPCGAAWAQGALADLPAVTPVMDCSAVANLDLTGATDGPVTIQSATLVPAGTPGPSTGGSSPGTPAPAPYCDVKGTIGPGTNMFELWLPTQGWTQRYLQAGCGGLCGVISVTPPMASASSPVAAGTIAIAATDMGHQSQSLGDASWAANNPQAVIDFAYRGQHVTSQVARAIIAKFYGQAPKYSYFDGCSDGGREALMEAQRFPEDFDGIAGGAPANDEVVQNTFHHGWNALTNLDANGNYILLASKLPLIHQAVLNACDGLDGVVDGVIDDPRACHFDPATLLCTPGQDPSTCLSEAEVGVVRRLHDGPTDANGNHLEQPIAHEWGSEPGWTLFVPATPAGPSGSVGFALPYLQYLAFYNVADPNYQITDLQFTIPYFYQTVETSHYMAATDPDLSAFWRHGSKLILWHGWSDEHITPQGTLQYYHDMRELLGAERVDNFTKLYLFPGVGHCGDPSSTGPNTFDILTPVMSWIETGTVPGQITASLLDQNGNATGTRPVYPYPAVARYSGSGSTDQAANFTPYTPVTEPRVGYNWVGRPLYWPGYESWCQAQGTQLVCEGGEPYPWEPTRGGPDWALSQP
ncbi:MAG: tannase/feruloyl esterase family alpha/beta hydrolase [Acetobacteraceae bacterium]|nr:tannase/feruloyl esterase family alpha/beta hydrolase [Acetobacteraceae bacterium]